MLHFDFFTRNNTDPGQKDRVFFAFSGKNEETAKRVAQDFLKLRDLAVMYLHPEPEMMLSEEDYDQLKAILASQKLLVIPVTGEFLKEESVGRMLILPLALETHVPILPILAEPGLEGKYPAVFGNLEYLDINDQDPTRIPYRKKLDNYLNSIFVGQKEREQIRSAFEAYVFLSYRKKDRQAALELMKTIHSVQGCQDIAIWYDEYLTPGEDFTDSIRAALEKSSLFTLVVTPSILEKTNGKPNFVMGEEYPAALAAGLPILPIEMEETDWSALNREFRQIRVPLKSDQAEQIRNFIQENLPGISLGRLDEDPRQQYYMGLAYLLGIDVEIDHDRALGLLTKSAKNGYIPAMNRLANVYRYGQGVERNVRKALDWLEKKAEATRVRYCADQNYNSFVSYARSLQGLGEARHDLGEMERAAEAYEEMRQAALVFSGEKPGYVTGKMLCQACRSLGDLYYELGRIEQARQLLRQAFDLTVRWTEETVLTEPKLLHLMNCQRCGDLELTSGRLDEARFYYEKMLFVCEGLYARESGKEKRLARQNLSVAYDRMGTLERMSGNRDRGAYFYEKMAALAQESGQEYSGKETLVQEMVSHDRMGRLELDAKQYDLARSHFEKAREIGLFLFADKNGGRNLDSLLTSLKEGAQSLTLPAGCRKDAGRIAGIYINLALTDEAEGRTESARINYHKASLIEQWIVAETGEAMARQNLAFCWYHLGKIEEEDGHAFKALRYYKKAKYISTDG